MLTHIHIRDLATIEEVELHLTHGCTMITGETGAGKSIFIEAIELALGGRGSPNLIRAGKEKADITLCFDITHFTDVIQLLKDNDLYQDAPECIVRRTLTSDGRSRCYVNGFPSTLPFVKELGEQLFHLHSQHEQQVLLKTDTQRDMLDRYADHMPLVMQVKQAAEEWKTVTANIKNLREKTLERTERSDYLRYQLEELDGIKLAAGEWEILEAEHHRLTHSEELLRNIQQALGQISDNESHTILGMLNETRKTIEHILPVEPKASEWLSAVHATLAQLNDIESELRSYLENTELDPEKLQQLEERVSHIFNLARKHKIAPQDLVAFRDRIAAELHSLSSSDEELTRLELQQTALEKSYRDLAMQLSLSRKKAAVKLGKEITTTIRSLSLPHGEFTIQLENDSASLSPHGLEKIIFLAKTNPDQTQQPLARVVSGGELSRLSLAAHLALAHRTSIPTLVFDEVDTGLSGATAEKIGRLLRRLAESYQVFCITHQAQVAACGHLHLLVEKQIVQNTTRTQLKLLNDKEKTAEIARMLGGEKITETTLEHAKEMLQMA